MTDMQPIRRKARLLERADDAFNLGDALRKPTVDGPLRPPAEVLPQAEAAPVPAPSATTQAVATPAPVAAPTVPAARAAAPEPVTAPALRPATLRSRLPVQALDRRRLADGGLIDPDAGANALSEEFRIIKRQILKNASVMPNGRRVLISSAQPDEGKTFTAVNLALSLAAENDRRVLLIDGDFARGDVPRRIGLTAGPGLMDMLQDPALALGDCVIDTDLPGLSLLPAGRASARDTELVASARMAELLAQIEAGMPDAILLFDSTPLLAASSAAALASHVGQVLVVVRAEVTREAALRDAIGLIGQHGGISLLLNRVRFTPEGRRFGSYYGEGG